MGAPETGYSSLLPSFPDSVLSSAPGSVLIYRSELSASTGNTASSSKTVRAWNSRERCSCMCCLDIRCHGRFQKAQLEPHVHPLDLCGARGPAGTHVGGHRGRPSLTAPVEPQPWRREKARFPHDAGEDTRLCSRSQLPSVLRQRVWGLRTPLSARVLGLEAVLAAETPPCGPTRSWYLLNGKPGGLSGNSEC